VEEFFKKANLTPRSGQLEAAQELAKLLRSNIAVGFEAPTGFGKTYVVLSALWAEELLPTTWRVRTYAQADHVATQALEAGLRPFIMGGRERTCPLVEEYGAVLPWYCKLERVRCPHFAKLVNAPSELSVRAVFSYEELRMRMDACVYYAQELISADIFIAPYKLGIRRTVTEVVDEAHNVIEIQSIREVDFVTALEEVGLDPDIGDEFDPRPLADHLEFALVHHLVRSFTSQKLLRTLARVTSFLRNAVTAWREEGEVHALKVYKPRATKSVFVSATLSPVARALNIPLLSIPAQRRKVLVTTWLTTRYTDFDEKMINKYNNLISLLRAYARRVLVFATKRVASVLSHDYYEDVPPDWQGVAALLSRGRKGEGVDVPADCVVVAGVPFLPPYVKLHRAGLTHEDMALVTVVQNVGRTLRGPSANPLVVLADERFLKLRALEEYFELKPVNGLSELKELLKARQQNSQPSPQ